MDLYNVLPGDFIAATSKLGSIRTKVTKINQFTVSTENGMQFKKHNGESHKIHYHVEAVEKPKQTFQLKDLIDKYGDISGAVVIPVKLISLNGSGLAEETKDSKNLNGKQVEIENFESKTHYSFGSYDDYKTSENILNTESYDSLRLLEALDIVELISLPEGLG